MKEEAGKVGVSQIVGRILSTMEGDLDLVLGL